MKHLASQIKPLIANGKLEIAIDRLLDIAHELDEQLCEAVILLSARFSQLKTEELMGHLPQEELERKRQSMNRAVLRIISKKPLKSAFRRYLPKPEQRLSHRNILVLIYMSLAVYLFIFFTSVMELKRLKRNSRPPAQDVNTINMVPSQWGSQSEYDYILDNKTEIFTYKKDLIRTKKIG